MSRRAADTDLTSAALRKSFATNGGGGLGVRTWLVAFLMLGACSADSDGTQAATPGQVGGIPIPGAHPNGENVNDAGLLAPPLAGGPAPPPGVGVVAVDPIECARAELEIKRAIPTVWLLVDGSGSMAGDLLSFGAPSRWDLLRETLLDPNQGLVARLHASVSFGLMIYDGGLSPPGVFIPASVLA